MKGLACAMIRVYQKRLRVYYPRQCIYLPTCSHYALLAIEKYGVWKGVRIGYRRIQRCNGALYQSGEDWP